MAVPLPPLSLPPLGVPSPADASVLVSHSSHPAVLTPSPTATSTLSPASVGSPSAPLPGGRTKTQRGSDDGGSSSPVASLVKGGDHASYRDVLVSSRSSSGTGFGGGWVKVAGRRARRLATGQVARQPEPRNRHLSVDLRGRCFNCFASHRAAACRSIVRCFHCRLPGHRYRVCPRRVTAPSQPRCVSMWRPVSKEPRDSPVKFSPCRAMEDGPLTGGSSAVVSAKKRTRRGQRKRKNGGG
jgi:hypothetical protein